jgi:hypothetical protein
LATIVESGPIPDVHGVVRWRLVDLCQWLGEEFRISVARQTLGRGLRTLGIASSALGRAIMPRPRERLSTLKSFPAVVTEIVQEKGEGR